ncbi:MAG: hypothetical protein HY681_00895 [Chloroflexi bacterium]|nr:hypothetical protein [Chloroflexota bacterium]
MKALSKKVGLGRFRMPLWALALAGVAIVAAAGQAVGPVLSGSVTGSAGLVVEQSLVLDDSSTVMSHSGTDDSLLVINDEGTSFTAAVEMHVGDYDNVIFLEIRNDSDADANAIVELNVPRGIDVEDEGASRQMSGNAWLLTVPANSSDALEMRVSPKDDLKPGFYTISGRIVQISG